MNARNSFSRLRSNLRLAAVSAVLVVSFSLAIAQDSFDYHAADLMILQSREIQTSLGITSAQRDKMNSYADANRAKLTAYKQELIKEKKTSADPNRLGPIIEDLKRKVFALLTPAQLKRLREVSLQHDGMSAIGDEGVAKKIGLSDSQLKKVRDIILADRKQLAGYQSKAEQPIMEKYKNVSKPKSDADKKALADKIRKDMADAAAKYQPLVQATVVQDRKRLMSVLTPAQRASWQALLGKPFKG